MNIRNGMTVAKTGNVENVEATEGRICTLSVKEYDSLNLAKKANGLNARTLKHGEKFPPTAQDYMRAAAEKEAA